MYVLMLNDMRSAHFEELQPAARAETVEQLRILIAHEQVELYQSTGANAYSASHTYSKAFREGGLLEWFNEPLPSRDAEHFVHVGTADDWAATARSEHEQMVMAIPDAAIACLQPDCCTCKAVVVEQVLGAEEA